MAIGVTRSAGYAYAGAVGTLNGATGAQIGNSLKFYKVVVADNSATAIDLRTYDDAVGELFEVIMLQFPQGVLAYFAADNNSGIISVVTDGVNAPAASVIQTAIRALGSSVSANAVDVRGTTVIDGTSFTVA
jgi:hypothetical protein